MLKARGEHVDDLLGIYADMLNQAIAGKPDGMTISMHLCRGNFRSTWIASGGYEPVAEVLFNQINADAYFMEYDTDRAGGFEPLRFVPRGNEDGRAGHHDQQDRRTGKQGRTEAPHRRGGEIPAAGTACAVAAMRLRLNRGGQHADRGSAMGQAVALRGSRAGGLGQRLAGCVRVRKGSIGIKCVSTPIKLLA